MPKARPVPPARRAVVFTDFAAMVADVEQLECGGYDQAGNWNLEQTCAHLADWLEFPVQGYPAIGFPLNLLMWGVRNTVGPGMLRKALKAQTIAPGKPTLPATVHAAGSDPAAAIARFKRAVTAFEEHAGPYQRSPMFGDLNREEARGLQLLHCSHHLSFLLPRTS